MSERRFAYLGDDSMGAYVESCLVKEGWLRVYDCGEADAVVTHFASAADLEDAYFETGGLVASAASQALLVDLSACAPSLAREIGAVAAVNDLSMAEAPLALIDPLGQLEWGNVRCFVAGEDEALRSAAELCDALACEVELCGPAGSAQAAKAADTVESIARVAGAVEASAFGRTLAGAQTGGVDEGMAALAQQSSLARSLASMEVSGDFDCAYTAATFMGDIAAALAAAEEAGVVLPHLEAALHLVELLVVVGGADKGIGALSLLYGQEEAGVEQGLDWSRAEGYFAQEASFEGDHSHDGQDNADVYSNFGEEGEYGSLPDFPIGAQGD